MFFFSACFTLLTDILISMSVCVYGLGYGYGCQPKLFLVPDGVWRGLGEDWVWSSFFWLWEIPSGWVRIFVMVYVYQWCSLFLFFMVIYVCLPVAQDIDLSRIFCETTFCEIKSSLFRFSCIF
jgi:hypothetical protein